MPLLISDNTTARWLLYGTAVAAVVAEIVATYLGFGLAIGSWVGALVWVAIVAAGYVPRIRVEEAELTRALGDSYRDYARTTARLVPGLW